MVDDPKPAQGGVNCIFQRPWWLEAVAPGQWQILEVVDNGRVRASMPIVATRRRGLRQIAMPRLTHGLGPWLSPSDRKLPRRIGQEKEWLTALIDQLPPFDYFCHKWHYSMQNWLPFHWRGFESSVSYTYVLQDLQDLDDVWKGYQENVRRQIRKAANRVTVRSDLGLDVLYQLTKKSFQRWGRRPPYSLEFLARLDEACVAQNARRCFFAQDAEGKVHAALYLVWDELSAYYLVGGADFETRNSGAMSLLMHEAIRFASTITRTFDFEGSMVEPIERFVRSFGGIPRPYFTIRGYSRRMRMVRGFRDMFARAAG